MKVIVAFMIVAIVVCAMVQESKQVAQGPFGHNIFWPQPHFPGMSSPLGDLGWPFDGHRHGNRHGHRHGDRHGHGQSPCPQLPDDCLIICPGSSTTAPETLPTVTYTSAMPTDTSPIMTGTVPTYTTQQVPQTAETTTAVAGK